MRYKDLKRIYHISCSFFCSFSFDKCITTESGYHRLVLPNGCQRLRTTHVRMPFVRHSQSSISMSVVLWTTIVRKGRSSSRQALCMVVLGLLNRLLLNSKLKMCSEQSINERTRKWMFTSQELVPTYNCSLCTFKTISSSRSLALILEKLSTCLRNGVHGLGLLANMNA